MSAIYFICGVFCGVFLSFACIVVVSAMFHPYNSNKKVHPYCDFSEDDK